MDINEFWTHAHPIPDSEDNAASAVRLIGEMLAADLLYREGDFLVGRGGNVLDLNAADQYLVRQIEEAVIAAG